MAVPAQVPAQDHSNGVNGTNGNGVANGVANTVVKGLSADEMALYDRQIRLWGAQAQQNIRSAHVLLVSLRALGTEIAKNLTLAGINSLTIVDDEPVTEDDLGAQFFLREADIGKPRGEAAALRVQELNPRVNVKVDGGLQALLTKDATYYAPFDCVIACDHDIMTLSLINAAARFASRPFYAAGIHGFYGYIFADLVFHEFVVEREKSNRATELKLETPTRSVVSVTTRKENTGKTTEIVKKMEAYCPLLLANTSPLPPDIVGINGVVVSRRKLKQVPALLPCLRALFEFQRDCGRLPDPHDSQDLAVFTTLATQKSRELQMPPEALRADFLRSFIQHIGSEITPTAAFVGGRLSEDVINVIGKREQPIQNFALFDGDALDARIYSLYTEPPAMTLGLGTMGAMPDVTMDIGAPIDMSGMNGVGQMVDMAGLTSNMQIDTSAMQGQQVANVQPNGLVLQQTTNAAPTQHSNGPSHLG